MALSAALVGMVFGQNRRAVSAFSVLGVMLSLWVIIILALGVAVDGAIGLLQILAGPLILFGALALQAPPPSRKLMACIAVYLLICALVEMFAPAVYSTLASALLDRFSVFDGHRGVSLLTPEPTYAAISCVYFLMLAWWSGKCWGFRLRWVEPVFILCLLATGSSYVALLFLVMACVHWPRFMLIASVVAVLFIPLIGVSALDNEDSVRAVVAISRLLSTDFIDFLPSISVLDSSLGSRLITNVASFLTLYHSPLGLGLGCAAVPSAYVASGFDFAFDNEVLSGVLESGCLKPQSYAAAVALGLGIFSIIFVFLMIILVRYSRVNKIRGIWAYPFFLSITLLIVQGQLSNPIPWLLMFLALTEYPVHARFCNGSTVKELKSDIFKNET